MRECRKEEYYEESPRWLLTPAFRDLGEEIAEETGKWLLAGRKKVSLVCVNPRKVFLVYGWEWSLSQMQ